MSKFLYNKTYVWHKNIMIEENLRVEDFSLQDKVSRNNTKTVIKAPKCIYFWHVDFVKKEIYGDCE